MLTKLFGYNPKETTVRTEVMAGLTTFLTMAYILAVNPNIGSPAKVGGLSKKFSQSIEEKLQIRNTS